jgi:hypothetical protein
MKLEFSWHIFEKYLDIKFRENPSSESRVFPCWQTGGRKDSQADMTNLLVAFRNFPTAPKNFLGLS